MKRVWLLIFAIVTGAGLLAGRTDFGKALAGLFTAGEPVISAIRYTLEIEAGGSATAQRASCRPLSIENRS
jgi:hypothetical protein